VGKQVEDCFPETKDLGLLVEVAFPSGTCVIKVDNLELSEEVDCLAAHFSEAHASVFHAAKWDVCFPSDCGGVYMNDACFKLVDKFEGS